MTREIKFRCWNKEHPMKETEWLDQHNHVEGCHLMQFTGLLDKNGKEIYEKDSREEYSFIDFCNHCFGYQEFYPYEGKNICHNCDGNYDIRDIDFSKETIIGNIYENPELLK